MLLKKTTKMTKKLLQINVTANWGSTGKIAEQIGVLAQQHGWESYIAYGRHMNASANRLIKIGSTLDTYEHYLENRFFDNEGRASRRATMKFLKEVDKIKPDIVHLHNIHDHYLNYPLLFQYLAEKNIPVVWTQHDLWAITGRCCYIIPSCERWRNKCHDCPMLNRFSVDRSLENHQLKKQLFSKIPSLTIVPVSEWLGNTIRQSYLKEHPIKVIHNGIDITMFSPRISGLYEQFCIDNQKKIILLGVACPWSNRKGLRDYLELSERLDNRFVIILVGLSEKQMADFPSNVIGLPKTQSQNELAELYSMSDILLSLSYGETFGMTMVEAYACGTPCIVYDNTAQPEIVTPNTGRVAKTGDIDEVARLVYEMTESNFKDNHSADCRVRAEQMYDKNKSFMKYIDLYESFIK